MESYEKIKILLVGNDDDNKTKSAEFLYRCILCELKHKGKSYYLDSGRWYEINSDFINLMESEIDSICVDNELVPYTLTTTNEGAYNANASSQLGLLCLDRKDIAPKGETQIEPCDILKINPDRLDMYHIKISTRSSTLSHLFNQGYASIATLRNHEESKNKLATLCGNGPLSTNYRVVYGIVTENNPSLKSKNLPLFSKITLYRMIKTLRERDVLVNLMFIERS